MNETYESRSEHEVWIFRATTKAFLALQVAATRNPKEEVLDAFARRRREEIERKSDR